MKKLNRGKKTKAKKETRNIHARTFQPLKTTLSNLTYKNKPGA